jgi:hypothetical protein
LPVRVTFLRNIWHQHEKQHCKDNACQTDRNEADAPTRVAMNLLLRYVCGKSSADNCSESPEKCTTAEASSANPWSSNTSNDRLGDWQAAAQKSSVHEAPKQKRCETIRQKTNADSGNAPTQAAQGEKRPRGEDTSVDNEPPKRNATRHGQTVGALHPRKVGHI